MAPGSGASTLISLSSVPSSLQSDNPSGLQSLRVQSVQQAGEANQITARLGSQTVSFRSQQTPPEGALLLGRLQDQGSGGKLKVLTTPQEIERVKTESLLRLLRGRGVDPGSSQVRTLMSKLSRQGYLRPDDLSAMGTQNRSSGESLAGETLTVTAGAEAISGTRSEGTVMQATVLDTEGDTARLKLAGERVTVQNPGGIREGTTLTVAVKESQGQPALEVQSVQSPSVSTDVLTDLGQTLGINPSAETLNRLESVLQSTRDQPLSDVLNQVKREFGSSVKIPTGETREAVLDRIQAYRQNPRESVLQELGELLNLKGEEEAMKRLQSVLLENRGADVSRIIEKLQTEFSTVDSRTLEQSRDTIARLIKQFQQGTGPENQNSTVQNLKNLNNDQLMNLLKNMGYEPDKKLLETARQIVNTDPSPTQENLRTVLENVQLARGEDDSLDSNRLRALLFLAKNDLPVKEETLDLLRPAAPGNAGQNREQSAQFLQSLMSSGNTTDALPESLNNALQAAQFSPGAEGSEDLAARLADAVRSMGFDLENRVGKNPDQAGKTLRSQMMALQQSLANNVPGALQGQSGDSNPEDSSRKFLSQLMKNSLASVADDDSIFLFVPFPDGEGTGLMRMRFEDEGEGDEVDDEEWTVTINVDLSQLGPLQVRARRHRELLNLTFKASESETVQLIEKNREQLEDVLDEKGFDASVNARRWNEEDDSLVDWNLYFDKSDYSGTFDVTV